MSTASSGSIVLLSDLLDAAALEGGDREALTDGRDRLTWRQYRDAAARLAADLIARGVAPGDRVGVLAPKSVRSFVAVHAIQRAGAVMVPVDWFAPPNHALDVLADAGATVVVGPLRGDRWSAVVDRVDQVVDTTDLSLEVDGRDTPIEPRRVAPDDPAYIIYTSGSTGRPKGIVHTHASALAYARLAVDTYDLGPGDRLANIAPLHFDQSTFELYAGPLAGAATIVVPDATMKFPASLARLLATESATVLYTVPYVIDQLVQRGAIGDLASLRWVKFGGESFPPAALRAAMRAIPSARFSNVYGPAEVNQCTFHHLAEPPAGDDAIPIGRPWSGAEVRIDRPDPDGAGELLVSASTAMRGYWGRPDLTAAAFGVEHGRRWYRTGDVVRPDGDELVFVGRADHQVKIRGQRVELEAVDAVLVAHPAVEAAASFVEAGGEQIVAVVSPVLDAEQLASIRRHAHEHLPPYAVPHQVSSVASLPRTSTGKVDRRAVAADQPVPPPPNTDPR